MIWVVKNRYQKISKKVEDQAFMQILVDDQNNPVLAQKTTPDGGMIVYKYQNEDWQEFFQVPAEDVMSFTFIGMNKDNSKEYLIDSRERNTAAFYAMDLNTGEKTLIGQNEQSDIQDAIIHPTEKTVQALASDFTTTEWEIFDQEIQEDLDYLGSLEEGEINLVSVL